MFRRVMVNACLGHLLEEDFRYIIAEYLPLPPWLKEVEAYYPRILTPVRGGDEFSPWHSHDTCYILASYFRVQRNLAREHRTEERERMQRYIHMLENRVKSVNISFVVCGVLCYGEGRCGAPVPFDDCLLYVEEGGLVPRQGYADYFIRSASFVVRMLWVHSCTRIR